MQSKQFSVKDNGNQNIVKPEWYTKHDIVWTLFFACAYIKSTGLNNITA